MIIRAGTGTTVGLSEADARDSGRYTSVQLSADGGLTQFGARVETLYPGSRSSKRHWHEREDELLYMLAGEATLVDNDGEHPVFAGDAICWPAGVANAHHLINRSGAPCTFLIVGTRSQVEVCHYPDQGHSFHRTGASWRVEDAAGNVLRSGHY